MLVTLTPDPGPRFSLKVGDQVTVNGQPKPLVVTEISSPYHYDIEAGRALNRKERRAKRSSRGKRKG